MPIYEFVCDNCQNGFERLVSHKWKEAGLTCPICGSSELKRAVSRPAGYKSDSMPSDVDYSSSSGSASHSCSSCSGGTCGTCH